MAKVSVTRGGSTPEYGRSKRVARFKRDLVLDLFLRRGKFWNAIEEARLDCNHVASRALPGGDKGLLQVFYTDDLGWSALGEEVRRKIKERVAELERRIIPDALKDDFLSLEWGDFLVACIIYDPPAEALEEFAEYGGPTLVSLTDAVVRDELTSSAIAPPIEVSQDPVKFDIARIVFMFEVIDAIEKEVEKRHPEIEVKRIIQDILHREDLRQSWRSRSEEVPLRCYLNIDEDTSLEDVRRGYHVIKGLQSNESNRGGAPLRDPLLAVQCAVLYDEFNEPDPADKRRRKWTYKRLAEKFGLNLHQPRKNTLLPGGC